MKVRSVAFSPIVNTFSVNTTYIRFSFTFKTIVGVVVVVVVVVVLFVVLVANVLINNPVTNTKGTIMYNYGNYDDKFM